MLKPSGQDGGLPPQEEPTVGELVHRLVEDGKAYARAELEVVKGVASAKAGALKLPAILFGAALLFLIAAVVVLAVAVFQALSWALGTFFGGVLTFLIFAGIAGGLAWFGVKKLQEGL